MSAKQIINRKYKKKKGDNEQNVRLAMQGFPPCVGKLIITTMKRTTTLITIITKIIVLCIRCATNATDDAYP